MAVKTFTAGAVLTAADTNTYLNNGGLVYVSSGSFSNAATFDITGFTSTYATWKIIVQAYRHSGTGAANLTATFRTATTGYATNYYGATWYVDYVSASGATGARNNGADFYLCQVYDNQRTTNIEIKAAYMNTAGLGVNVVWDAYNHGGVRREAGGYEFLNSGAVALDRIRVAGAVNVSGNWRLYGFREP